ncbi:hypothetical protein [Clostridioides difficile]|nr:hypothetical protein [Clostridioides difficile]
MVIRNKLSWNSIEEVNRDFGSCLYTCKTSKSYMIRKKCLSYGLDT